MYVLCSVLPDGILSAHFNDPISGAMSCQIVSDDTENSLDQCHLLCCAQNALLHTCKPSYALRKSHIESCSQAYDTQVAISSAKLY